MIDAAKPHGGSRKASRDVRRRQLIDATIDTLARRGYAELTLAHVADTAGLSRGIVNFHFESKQKLLVETLRHLAAFYEQHWRERLAAAGPDPAARLWAMMEADFDPTVCNSRHIGAWTVLRAEARTRPTYRAICGERDHAYLETLTSLLGQVDRSGGRRDVTKLAMALESLTEGLWLKVLMGTGDEARKEARDCAAEFLSELFPERFERSGPLPARGAVTV